MSFTDAYDITSKHEGRYANHKLDRGGETYKGIARKFHPKWEGWVLLDSFPVGRKDHFASKDKILQHMVVDFYKEKFWDPIDKYPLEQDVKIYLYDYSVNSGHKNAYKAFQRALGVKPDGVIGKQTLHAYARTGSSFVIKLKKERDKFYSRIIKKNPSQKVFGKGWYGRSEDVLCYAVDKCLVHKKKPVKMSFWAKLFKGV